MTSVDEVCAWLLECEYAHDEALFNEPDFWQHPRTFEHLRKGDCEDHALWAWRKLVELGYEAELISGDWQPLGDPPGGHVWVRFKKDGQDFIFETVGGKREDMIRSLADAKAEYIPHAGIDQTFQRYAYFGYMRVWQRDRVVGGA